MRRDQVPPGPLSICRKLVDAGHQAVVVGGCVRDTLLGREAKDWDVATSAHPDEVQRLFKKTIPTGIQHGTVTVLSPDPVEVTTFRGEGAYSDARRPDRVVFGVTLEEDLSRRDFTMNAVAFDPVGEALIDPFGGQDDLAASRLRAVGDAATRFREDGLRVLRAVRFMAVLELELDPATCAAIPGALDSLAKVSAERVRDELVKMLAARKPSIGLRVAQQSGILRVILPELEAAVGCRQNRFHIYDVWEHTLHVVDETVGDPIRRMGSLLHDVAKPRTAAPRPDAPGEFTFYKHDQLGAEMADEICRRLRFSNKERQRIVSMVAHHMFWYTPEWTDGGVRRFIKRIGEEQLEDLFALREGDVRGRGRGEDPDVEIGELKRRIDNVLRESQALTVNDLAINGRDIMDFCGIPPGPRVGEILRALLERVLEDPSLNQRDALLDLAEELCK